MDMRGDSAARHAYISTAYNLLATSDIYIYIYIYIYVLTIELHRLTTRNLLMHDNEV